MGRSRSRSSSNRSSNWNVARVLAALGGLLALIGFAIALVQSLIATVNIELMLYGVAGILVSIFVVIQVRIFKKSRLDIPFNWWLLLIFAVLQAIIAGLLQGFVSVAGLGILLEVIAVIILILQAL